jgi:hypothetical protein
VNVFRPGGNGEIGRVGRVGRHADLLVTSPFHFSGCLHYDQIRAADHTAGLNDREIGRNGRHFSERLTTAPPLDATVKNVPSITHNDGS